MRIPRGQEARGARRQGQDWQRCDDDGLVERRGHGLLEGRPLAVQGSGRQLSELGYFVGRG